jgi:hypothetical protein
MPFAMNSSDRIDRRTFFKRFAQIAGTVVLGGGTNMFCAGTGGAFSIADQKIGSRWRPLVAGLNEYVQHAYVKYDRRRARIALESLHRYGLNDEDVIPLQNVNRHLIAKGMFLAFFYLESPTIIPVTKIFLLVKQDIFDGFLVQGTKCSSLYGQELGSYDRVLLGDEVCSSVSVPPIALAYDLAYAGSQTPAWVIAIPSAWIESLYGKRVGGIQERLIEELTIHEIAHIIHRTRDELIPFLAQFGYKIGGSRRINEIDDLIRYLREHRLTYHQAERFILERIYNADSYYGSSGNAAHLSALSEIKNGLEDLSKQVHEHDRYYPVNMLRISDQQCWASMALLYHRAVQRKMNTCQS